MKIFLSIPILFLTSCVSMKIPPFGENAGQLGTVELRIVYKPNVFGTMQYFLTKQQPKPTSSK